MTVKKDHPGCSSVWKLSDALTAKTMVPCLYYRHRSRRPDADASALSDMGHDETLRALGRQNLNSGDQNGLNQLH